MNLTEVYSIFQKKYSFPDVSTNFVPGVGSTDAKLFIIGEAPGQTEDKLGVPFCGKSGEILDKLLQGVNLERENIFITNLFKYRPPNNRKPRGREVSASVPLLSAEIKLVNPSVIVPMGAIPQSVLVPGKINKVAGQVFHKGGRIVIPTWHPACASYDEKYLPILHKHFEIIKEALNV